MVTRGYLWLPVKKLHLSALNNCYFKLNWKRKQKLCTIGFKTRHYVIKVTFGLRRHVSIGLPTVNQVLWYHFYITLVFEAFSAVNSMLFYRQNYRRPLVLSRRWQNRDQTGSRIGSRIGSRKNIQNSKFKIQNSQFCWANYTRVTTVSRTFHLIQVWYSFILL